MGVSCADLLFYTDATTNLIIMKTFETLGELPKCDTETQSGCRKNGADFLHAKLPEN